MTEPRTHPPGWYADPEEPDRLAYWDGGKWTGEHRPRPTWTGRKAGRGGKGRLPIPGHGRRQWLVIAAAVLVVGGLAYAALPKHTNDGPRVLTDATFIAAANQRCAAVINDIRPPLSPDGKAPTNAEQADAADRAADGLSRLADDLHHLPVAAADEPHINAWLDDWAQYIAVGHRTAAAFRSAHPHDALAVGREGDAAQRRADRFSRANGLSKCQFFIVPNGSGSDPFSGGQ